MAALNRASSRQLSGQFNALNASRSHTGTETIDISSGTYGSGKEFAGASGVSSPLWDGYTGTFYIYLDKNTNLVLDGDSFVDLTTRIARVSFVDGYIDSIIDERAVVNGLLDAYQVAFNASELKNTSGDNVQEAIENLDAYVSSINNLVVKDISKKIDLDINGGLKNGAVCSGQFFGSPSLHFLKKPTRKGRVIYHVSIPHDYIAGNDIKIKLLWSPPTSGTGDIHWQIRYRLIEAAVTQSDSALTSVSYVQSAPGVDNRVVGTGDNLFVSSGDVLNRNQVLILDIERLSDSFLDTYPSDARVHAIQVEYIGKGVEE